MEEEEEELASSPSELQFSSGRFIPHYFNYYKREMTRRMRRRRARNARGRSVPFRCTIRKCATRSSIRLDSFHANDEGEGSNVNRIIKIHDYPRFPLLSR